jgi:hypothetical protein
MIKVSVEFTDKRKFDNMIRYFENLSLITAEAETVNLADSTVQTMRDKISNSKKRRSFGDNLESNIEWEEIINDPGKELLIGIGRISQLTANAPYWEVLNDGGYVPYSTRKGAPLGSFEGYPPEKAGGKQNWERSGQKGFFMKPKTPIEGIDYIGAGIRKLDQELNKMLRDVGGKLIEEMKKV